MRCDPLGSFGSAIDLLGSPGELPCGVTHVDTTLAVPGEVQLIGCPYHGIGCLSGCPVLKHLSDLTEEV